ncbi:H-NS family nucleoid-associated regulatory protein [Pigmentiphaga kullae]|uniref:DNA-binding protein H-NS n=1 Tax=Pigmentiphaga kullae TaxID=151784 RepID=A0A4Q7NNA9_9BURK|nr:H-NS histone family protein [Pigmentiphaga kullae]RZS86552.1 DNA-binding protein H-NS [Pigmentiphaga kullae]
MVQKSYQALQSEIKKLQQKADSLRLKQRQPVVESILRSMEEYSISIDELKAALTQRGSRRKARVNSVASKRANAVAAKYRNQETGETWTGRGKPPRWLAAVEASGVGRERFLISN